MDELLTDQQQAEVVRNWLRENGWVILVGLVLGLGGLFGLNKWRDYQAGRDSEASSVYEELIGAVLDSRPVRAAELEATLVGEFSGTPYVDQARLAMAKLHMDRSEAEEAAGYLQRLVADTDDEGMRRIARLRLARVRIQQQRYDDAIEALAGIDENSAFAGRYHEVRGDAYYAMGQIEDARREYESALERVQSETLNRALVQVKLDSLGAAPAVPPAPEESVESGESVEGGESAPAE